MDHELHTMPDEPYGAPEVLKARPPMTSAELGRLFYREIAYDHVPHIGQGYEGEPAAQGIVEGAAHMQLGTEAVNLRGHQLFIFNALLHLRDKPGGIAYNDVKELGFSPGVIEGTRTTNWTVNLPYLAKRINTAADLEIIYATRSGRWRRHHIHPGFELLLSDTYETKPEGFYEFAQEINGPLFRHNAPHTVEITKEDPVDAVIRDDEVIVVNGIATQLNDHDRALLHLMTFNKGRPLGFDQFAALGFHPYAPPGQGRKSALYRSIHRINQAFDIGDERPLLFLDTGTHNSNVRVLRSYKLTDVRSIDASVRSFSSVRPAFEKLMEHAPEFEDRLGLSLQEVRNRFKKHGSRSLTLAQAYTLSMRLGVHLPELSGTTYTARSGQEIAYDNLAPHIVPGTPMMRSRIGELMGGQGDGSIHTMERYGLTKLRNAGMETELLRRAGGMAKAIADAEDIPSEDRLENFLTGDNIDILLTLEGRPTAEREAVIAHFLPAGLRKAARHGDLYNGLPWMRRLYKTAAPEILDAPGLELLPHIEGRLNHAHTYFLALIGSPGEGKRAVSFADLAASDPEFAREGAQLIADLLAVLVAKRIPLKPRWR